MVASGPSAANSCLPPTSPVVVSVPPVPMASRGVRCMLDGKAGRVNADKSVLVYYSGKLVVALTLDDSALLPATGSQLSSLVYRGHAYPVSACKLSPSGAYMVSGDERGCLRVWAFDHPEHLAKYESNCLTGAVRDVDWDSESKRLAIGGERNDARSECAKALQWDGVTAGQLSQFAKGRVASVSFKPNRPFRIVTAGMDEPKCYFHKGPPFIKIPAENGVPAESSHTRGGVQCVRYNTAGTLIATVSTDRSICLYDGTTMEFKSKLENVHSATIYSVAWSKDDSLLLTASGDGTCKLFAVDGTTLTETRTWNVAKHQAKDDFSKVPVGGTQLGCTFVHPNIPVSVGLNGQVSILNPDSDAVDRVMTGHYAAVAGLAVDEANGVFYTGDTDGIMCKWDLATTKPIGRLEPPEGNADLMYVIHSGAISGVATVSEGTLYSVGWDDKFYCTDKDGKVGMSPVALGAQPTCIATGSSVGVIVTVNGLLLVKDGKLTSEMISIPYTAKCACVSKDDKTVFVGGEDCKIHVYDSSDGSSLKEKHVIEGKHLKTVHALALSNDGAKLASGDEKDICVFDVANDYATLIGRGRWCFHLQRITCLAWSADDSVLASGGADDSIYLWNLQKKMKRVHYQYAHRGGLTGLTFLGDKMELLSVGVDSVVNRWDVAKDVAEKFA